MPSLELRGRALDVMFHTIARARIDRDRTIVLAGSQRSGTEWTLESVSRKLDRYVSSEPELARPRGERLVPGFEWRTYLEPGAQANEAFESFLARVLAGTAGFTRVSRGPGALRRSLTARDLVVKFVRAHRYLGWMSERFDVPLTILLVRHPCAAVSSQHDRGWGTLPPEDVAGLIETTGAATVPDHLLEPHREQLAKLRTRAGVLAARWCFDQLVALEVHPPSRGLVVSYEGLVLDPDTEWARIDAALRTVEPEVGAVDLGRPSRSASRDLRTGDPVVQLAKWQEKLSTEEIDEVLELVHGFGFDFYDADPAPDPEQLRARLAETACGRRTAQLASTTEP